MKGFLKIPYEWVQKSGQGLTATEALVLADIQYWKNQSTLAERSERLGLSIEGLRKALSKLQEKGFEIPQSRKYISTKLKNNFNNVENKTNKVEIKHQQSGNPPYNPPIIIEDNKEYKEYSSPSSSDGPKEKKEKPKVYSLQYRCQKYFEQEFKKFKGVDYYFEGVDAGNLKQLLNKLKKAFEGLYNRQPSDEDTELFFQQFINSLLIIKPDAWVIDKLSIKNINSQFNVIYPKIINGKSSSNAGGRHDSRPSMVERTLNKYAAMYGGGQQDGGIGSQR